MQEDLTEKIQAALVIIRRAMVQIEALPNLSTHALHGLSLRDMAERFYLERRKREEHFPTGLFGEPAWDLLLAMFVAREDGRVVTFADACSSARVTPAKGRTLIGRLEAEGLVAHTRKGGRREFHLTSDAVERLSDYLLACLQERLTD